MKYFLTIFLSLTIGSLVAHADGAKVEAAIAVDKDTKPTDTFSTTVPQLYAFFRSTGTAKDDKLRGVWIAEDVGNAAPANTKIDESTLTADQDNYFGAFSLTKPTAGWPPGKYRVEIYLNDALATTAKFTIEADK
jgi:outer membrane usher protein FimD/PapC